MGEDGPSPYFFALVLTFIFVMWAITKDIPSDEMRQIIMDPDCVFKRSCSR